MHCDGPVHGEFAGLAALPEGDLDGKIVGAGKTLAGIVGESVAIRAGNAVLSALGHTAAQEFDGSGNAATQAPGTRREGAAAGLVACHTHGGFVLAGVAERAAAGENARTEALGLSDRRQPEGCDGSA